METEKNTIPTKDALQARELYFNESFAPSSETDQEGGTASHNLAEDRSSETTKQPDDKKTSAELEQLETRNPNVEMDEEQLKQVLQMYLAIVDHSVDEMPVHEQTNGNQATGPDSDLQSMDDYVDRIMKVYQAPDRVTETGENVASSLAAHDKELQSSQGEREDLIAFPVSECSKTVVKKEMKRFSYKAPELSEFKVSAKRSKKYDESDKSPKAVHNSKRMNEVINPRASTSSEIVETPIRKRKHFKPAPAAFKKVNDRKDSNYSSSSNLPSGVAKKKDSNSSVDDGSDGLKKHNDTKEKADENSDPNSPGNGNEIVEVIYYNPNGVEVVINCAVVSEH
ncbi:hypothetical protein KR044_012381 [Drosophila immigrans]|nr:hypothetical protein KR044_012381 [Drosophila immigrans]